MPDLNGRGRPVTSCVTVKRRSDTTQGMFRITLEHALNWCYLWAIQDLNL